MKELKKREINYRDMNDNMAKNKKSVEKSFFVPQHHWKQQVVLPVANEICEKLQED